MASRSVNSLQFCKDDMRRAYRERAGNSRRRRIKIRDIIDILDIIVPVIPHFFGNSSGVAANSNGSGGFDNYNNNSSYGRDDDDMLVRYGGNGGSGRFGLGMGSGDFGNECSHYGSHHGSQNGHYGMRMGRADDYYDREISEEEFERLLEFAEQRNNGRMY